MEYRKYSLKIRVAMNNFNRVAATVVLVAEIVNVVL